MDEAYNITNLRPIKLNTQMKKRYKIQVCYFVYFESLFYTLLNLSFGHLTLHFSCASLLVRLLNVSSTFQFHKAIFLSYSM
jgi:hypothetical protein